MPKILLVGNTDWMLYNFRLPLARALRDAGLEVVFVGVRLPGRRVRRRLAGGRLPVGCLEAGSKEHEPGQGVRGGLGLAVHLPGRTAGSRPAFHHQAEPLRFVCCADSTCARDHQHFYRLRLGARRRDRRLLPEGRGGPAAPTAGSTVGPPVVEHLDCRAERRRRPRAERAAGRERPADLCGVGQRRRCPSLCSQGRF